MREEDLALARIIALERQEERDTSFGPIMNPIKHSRVQDLALKRSQFR